MATFDIDNSNILFKKYDKEVLLTVNAEANSHTIPQKENWEGDVIEGRLETALMTSVGAASGDGASFPVADRPRFVTWQVGRKFYHASAELSLGIIAAAKGGADSARAATDAVVRSLTKATIKDKNVDFFGDGTGIRASFQTLEAFTIDTAADIVLNGRYSATYTRDHSHPNAGIWPNGTYQVRDESNNMALLGTVVVNSLSNLSVPGANSTVNVTPSTTFSAAVGDVLVKSGAYGVTMSGLHKLIDNDVSGTFQGITMSNATQYTSIVMGNSNTLRALNATLLRQVLQGLAEKSGQLPGRLMAIGHPSQLNKFADIYEGQLQIAPNDSVMGNKATVFQSPLGMVELKMDTDCPPTDLFFVDRAQLRYAEQRPLSWVMRGGEQFFTSLAAPVNQGHMYEVAEMYIKDRRKCAKITDLSYELVAF